MRRRLSIVEIIICMRNLGSFPPRLYYYDHSTEEENETQREEKNGPKSQANLKAELGLKLRTFNSITSMKDRI